MSWSITFEQPNDLLVVKTTGDINYQQLKQMTKETFMAAKYNGASKVLGDHRALAVNVSKYDVYRLPRDLIEEGVSFPEKVAILYSEEAFKKEDFQFFEVTASNVGMQVELFTDPVAAREWLGATS